MSALDFARALAPFVDGPDDDPEPRPCGACSDPACIGDCPESYAAYQEWRERRAGSPDGEVPF